MSRAPALPIITAASMIGGALFAGCSGELANSTDLLPRVETPGWPDSVAVNDIDTLELRVTLPNSESVTGLRLRWQSSDPTKLDVQAWPVRSGSRADSLAAQLKAITVARARDSAVTITVTVDQPGFVPATMQRTIAVMERWTAVSVGESQTCALTVGASAYCWGSGQGLGNPGVTVTAVPAAVRGAHLFHSLSAGDRQVCGEVDDGLTYCWGFNGYGALGDLTQITHVTPAPVTGGNFVTMDVGNEFACGILLDDGTTQCWGNQAYGQLGEGPAYTYCTSFAEFAVICRPGMVFGASVRITNGSQATRNQYCTQNRQDTSACPLALSSVSAGADHACGVIRTVQAVFCWGRNASGQVGGKPFDSSCIPDPYIVGPCSAFGTLASQDTGWHTSEAAYSGPRFATVSAGTAHTCGLTVAGQAYCWGSNQNGEFGNGSFQSSPFPVPGASGIRFSSLSAGNGHTCGIDASAVALCWGLNGHGELGNPTAGTTSATPVARFCPHHFASVSAGSGTTCGVTMPAGAVYCWGQNLGNGTDSMSAVPVRIAEPAQ